MFERLIAAVAPGWARARAEQRALLHLAQARYEGARRTRATRNWRPTSTGPNAEIELALRELRNRSRDLVRNNAWISGGLDLSVGYQIGTGIVPRSNTKDPAVDQQVNEAFGAWAKHASLSGGQDFYALQAQAVRGRSQDGEALGLLLPLSPAEMRRRGVAVPLAIQLIEPDLLDDQRNTTTREGNRVIQGKEIDARGQTVSYHLLEVHPGEDEGSIRQSTRVIAADSVVHLYRQDRPGQMRGVPDLASVLNRVIALDELEDAALHQAKVQACVAAFVMSAQTAGRGPLERAADGGEQINDSLAPGIIERLLPGEDVKFLSPSGAGGFSELAKHQLHAIAAAWGLTYDLLTGDLSSANYSSLRAGRLAFKRRLEQQQWLLIIPRFCQPIWDAWVNAALRAGVLPPRAGGYPVEWSPPAFEMVDPLKDAMAERLMLRLGLRTWPQAVAAQGYDPEEQALEIARTNETLDRLKLILDGDPRRVTSTGGAQDAAQLAAIELRDGGAI